MAKVICERPRPGSREGSRPRKGYARSLAKALADAPVTGDSPPNRERRLERYGYNKRFFNENLAPLRRFLLKQVGRPWDKVHAEICERIDRGNVVQKHILTHLSDFVVTRVREENGELYDADRGGRWQWPLRDSRQDLYVCPRTGLLRRTHRMTKRERRERLKPDCVERLIPLGDGRACLKRGGTWFLVTLRPFTEPPSVRPCPPPPDLSFRVLTNLPGSPITVTFGGRLYAVNALHQMGKRELLRYPVPIDEIRRVT